MGQNDKISGIQHSLEPPEDIIIIESGISVVISAPQVGCRSNLAVLLAVKLIHSYFLKFEIIFWKD